MVAAGCLRGVGAISRPGLRSVALLPACCLPVACLLPCNSCLPVAPRHPQGGFAGVAIAGALRLVQGLGTEPGAPRCAVLLAEAAAAGGGAPYLIASLAPAGAALGAAAAAAVTAAFAAGRPPAAFAAWGWRAPLTLALAAGAVDAAVRLRLVADPFSDGPGAATHGAAATRGGSAAGAERGGAVWRGWRRIPSATLLGVFPLTAFHLLLVLPVPYLSVAAEPPLPAAAALGMQAANALALAACAPLGGWLADAGGGPGAVLLVAAAVGGIVAFPAWALITSGAHSFLWLGQLLQCAPTGLAAGALAGAQAAAAPRAVSVGRWGRAPLGVLCAEARLARGFPCMCASPG